MLASARKRHAPTELKASATLPASGAYESDPSVAAMTAIPDNVLTATIAISYTRGGSGGYAAHKVFLSDGTRVFQVQAADGTYDGTDGRASVDDNPILYSLTVDVSGGATKIGIASAEVGATGTPGDYVATVTFQ